MPGVVCHRCRRRRSTFTFPSGTNGYWPDTRRPSTTEARPHHTLDVHTPPLCRGPTAVVRQRTTNKVRSSGPPNKPRSPGKPRHEQERHEREREMGKGKKTLAAARTDPLSRGMAVDPFDENRCCNCGTPSWDHFSLPPPLMSERAKCPHLVVRDPRTVERGRLLCVVLCMLQFGLHKHNYCCAYLLSLSLFLPPPHAQQTLCRWDL